MVEGVRGDEVVEVEEREVIEVGRNEVVGVRVDSIPITVVEIEGRGERNYDVNAEIVEEVKQYRSELRTRDSLGHLVENYEISSRVLVRPTGVEERACSAPQDHWMPVYSHYLIAGLRFPLPELLVGLLLDYNIGLTQLVPNAMRGGSRRDKGWYYFTPRVASRESRSLFTAVPSSIKGWKEKFFFVDDTEWGKEDAEVRELAAWKTKRANQNSAQCIEAAELYGPSALSEAEMDQFLNIAGGAAIPKKPRKKSKTSTKQVDEGRTRKEAVLAASAEMEEERVVEEETGNEVLAFVPQPSSVELDPELRQLEEGAEVRAPAEMDQFLNTAGGAAIPKKPRKKSKTSTKQVDEGRTRKEAVLAASAKTEEEVPQLKRKGWEERRALQKNLFEAKNITGARWFINNTFPEVDQSNAREEALRYGGASVVKHVLEVNGLAQEFRESLKDRALLQRQRDQLQKEKEELEKKNKELQESLNEVVPTVSQLEQERASLSTKLTFKESKRRIAESEREAQAQEMKLMTEAFKELKGNMRKLVHNGMKEHISNFISSSSFDSIVNLYRLPTTIIAFTDCRKKVKAEYPEVDVTKITFGEQEEGFDFEFVVMEEEGAEVEEGEMEAGVEGTEVGEVQPVPEVEIHPVPSDDEKPPLSMRSLLCR
ncbi:hypothetical protein SLEP1_g22520 [Rubroshorea leprosula]|uniref:Uncharacterized protein n=1 Tax=Rubroshorea leprosula TaxID=152421 RepID=A0AAV5J9G8_9ROSI|nr:hypothetical protein SLEP1_g22520 [Rubroshorea leprosula]